MNQKPATPNLLQRIPTKWAIAIVAALIVYSLAQPFLNQRFGWDLPSIASFTGQEGARSSDPSTSQDSTAARDSSSSNPSIKPESEVASKGKPSESDLRSASKGKQDSVEASDEVPLRGSTETTTKIETSQGKVESDDEGTKKFGFLVDLGRNRFRSPAGLVYGPGSEEGHRLKHIEKHLKDQEDRPGSHGVFDGDMAAVVRWIDDAYERAEKKAKGTTKRLEDERTVIEANFEKPIGYVGGRDGKRKGHPPAKRLRLVVDDRKNVITAFPF